MMASSKKKFGIDVKGSMEKGHLGKKPRRKAE